MFYVIMMSLLTMIGEAKTATSLHVPGFLRTRVPSHHMRELARGKFMVRTKDITLLDCIGEGL